MLARTRAIQPARTNGVLKAPDLSSLGGRPLVEVLRAYWVPDTVPSALTYLRGLIAPLRLLALYKHYFPDEFAASKASTTLADNQVYTDAEIDFLRLVDSRLFPLADHAISYYVEEWVDEYPDPSERPDPREFPIPVWPTGLMDWEEANRAYFRAGMRFLMEMVAPAYEYVDDPLADELEAARELNLWGRSPDGDQRLDEVKLHALLVMHPRKYKPLRALPKALDMLSRDTDCVFLDAYQDEALGPSIEAFWGIEDMEWLILEHKKAQEYEAEVNKFLDWLEAKPANMWLTISLLLQCIRDDRPAAQGRSTSRRRVRTQV